MKISDEQLELLICSLEEYKKQGVYDPWIVSDGTVIQPLDVLKDLRDARETIDTMKESIS